MTAEQTLPHWDMSVIFPGLDSPEFDQAFQSVIEGVASLSALFERDHIGRSEHVAVDRVTVARFETLMEQFGTLLDQLTTVRAYIGAFVSTNSRDDLAQARLSELQQHMVLLAQLETRFVAWLGSLDVQELVRSSAVARDHAYMLEQAVIDAQHLMPQPQEDLTAELEVSGGAAWGKLHTNVTSQLMVPIELEGDLQQLPMAVIRNLALDSDRDVRRRAYEAEIEAWSRAAVPLAAALNSIKGETNTVDGRRNWASALDAALFNNSLDRKTLDAMMEAARAAFPDFRRYLHAKARALGIPALAWYDLFAPVGQSAHAWEFDAAVDFMLDQFGSYSPELREFGARAFRERWIDAEPREGKQGGAFCMAVLPGVSRVLANYTPSYDGMSTLAHELGHAYHNFNLASRTPFQRGTPMVLAETASIFCETIVRQAALARADEAARLAILEASLQNATQLVVDISSRFLFESRVFERRRERELSIDELNALMLDTQRETYGHGLDDEILHPYMWAVKGHYYSAGYPYYNFPYMFGFLFGLGLYARYRRDPDAFRAGYDELLSSTGLADAATLAARFGIDIRTSGFWNDSLNIVRGEIDRFEALVDARATTGAIA